jgi:tryptophan-rich sensory protein
MKTDVPKLAAAVVICLAAGVIGWVFTAGSIPTWYAGLQKPSYSPPNWVFAPVWTALYILMGISAYLVWTKGWGKKEVRSALSVFGAQLLLNTAWSIIFFGLKDPYYAFIEIVFLWAAIVLTIWKFNGISRNAALLLVPYILWVSFAALLNYSVWRMNV